jgi:uncharacterized repeat protein (TIGR01451 family)
LSLVSKAVSRTIRLIMMALFVCVALMQTVRAQSACTALWATIDNDAGGAGLVHSLRYFNNTTNLWTNLTPAVTLVGNANAIAGDPVSGLIYYVDRSIGALRVIDLNTRTDVSLGNINPPPGGVNNILGAAIPTPGTLILYATNPPNEFIGRINLANPPAATWTQILTVGGVNPALGNSGDIVIDQQNRFFIASNTAPNNSLWALEVNPASPQYSRVTQTLVLGSNFANLWGVTTDPISGALVIGTLGSGTFFVNTATGVTTPADPSLAYGVTDMGNCILPPLASSITKSFTPTYRPLGAGTATLTIRINNPNSVPVWLKANLVDTLPPGMQVATPNNLTQGACASIAPTATAFGVTNNITATSGQSTVTFAAGGRIPAGGCTITVSVTAPANGAPYVNQIPVNGLQTSSGNNTTPTTATFKVGTDFSAVKRQATTGALQTTTLGTAAGQTITYVLTFVNTNIGGTGSATFSDTIPAAITPVLTVNAAHSGGGACVANTSTVATSTLISGTITNALAGSTCTVTVTGRISGVSTPTTLTNTVTITPTAGTSDTSATNNISTVTATITPAAGLSVTKTSGTTQTVAGGTIVYTVTFANAGPSPANNATIQDTPGAGLSSCTVLSCTPAGGAVCPATLAAVLAPSTTTIPTFPANSSLTFSVRCRVPATGL